MVNVEEAVSDFLLWAEKRAGGAWGLVIVIIAILFALACAYFLVIECLRRFVKLLVRCCCYVLCCDCCDEGEKEERRRRRRRKRSERDTHAPFTGAGADEDDEEAGL